MSSATYNANNQLTFWGGMAVTFSYDDNGNVTVENDQFIGESNTYQWNARNQLASINNQHTFGYDAFGRRRTKTHMGIRTDYLYDGLNYVQEKDGATVRANLLTGLGIDEVFRRVEAATPSDYLTDALGSTIALTDSTKAVTASFTYDPYGTSQPLYSGMQLFTGREMDIANGVLYYYRARYYSPRYMRFMSEDPIGFAGGPNVYAYVDGNPVSFVDPDGLQAFMGPVNPYYTIIRETRNPPDLECYKRCMFWKTVFGIPEEIELQGFKVGTLKALRSSNRLDVMIAGEMAASVFKRAALPIAIYGFHNDHEECVKECTTCK